MVFSSNIFLFAFLPLVFGLYFLLPKKPEAIKYRNSLLLFASLFFYAWGEVQYLILLIISISANYFFGIKIEKSLKKSSKPFIIFFAIAFNLLLLGYFKYANFIVENLNQIISQFSSYKIEYTLPTY